MAWLPDGHPRAKKILVLDLPYAMTVIRPRSEELVEAGAQSAKMN